MSVNPYFTQGTSNEQRFYEDIIIESLKIYGRDVNYIPRTLVSKDNILGEDRLSIFKESYPIEMYFENIDSFSGDGFFIAKFGMMVEQAATLVVSRRRWEELIGRYGDTIIPERPCEGDLIYFPLSKGLFEIKFVSHQNPFYQLGNLYTYKLEIELFQYASERLETGIEEIDAFESLKTFSTNPQDSLYGEVTEIQMINQGSGYVTAPLVTIDGDGTGATAIAYLGTDASSDKVVRVEVTNPGTGYTYANVIFDSGTAEAEATVLPNIDRQGEFGDNNEFKNESIDYLINENNPFGDIK